MKEQLFRKSSIQRVSSPDQLNDYVRVSNPGVWMILAAVIILLAGVFTWGVLGRLDTKLDTAGTCRDGVLTCYVADGDIDKIKEGMEITAEGKTWVISEMEKKPQAVSRDMDPYLLHLGGWKEGQWVYAVKAETDLPDGTCKAAITTESVSPISFILN